MDLGRKMNRCARTKLTRLQVHALAGICQGYMPRVPHGIYRALAIRGLIDGERKLTRLGCDALGRCMLLSPKFKLVQRQISRLVAPTFLKAVRTTT